MATQKCNFAENECNVYGYFIKLEDLNGYIHGSKISSLYKFQLLVLRFSTFKINVPKNGHIKVSTLLKNTKEMPTGIHYVTACNNTFRWKTIFIHID